MIKCDAGVHLSDESVCKAYQASFMLGNPDASQRNRHKEVTGGGHGLAAALPPARCRELLMAAMCTASCASMLLRHQPLPRCCRQHLLLPLACYCCRKLEHPMPS